MPLEHAILAFIEFQPMTGYDLKKNFDVSVAHFWSATQSHIYKSLEALEKKAGRKRMSSLKMDAPTASSINLRMKAASNCAVGWSPPFHWNLCVKLVSFRSFSRTAATMTKYPPCSKRV